MSDDAGSETKKTNRNGNHLYVMQASDGQVKIGRSGDPKTRLRDLQVGSGRQIKLVTVLENEGHRERAILDALVRYRSIGEWFRLHDGLPAAVSAAVGTEIRFPYPIKRKDRATRRQIEEAAAEAAADEIKRKALQAILERAQRRPKTGRKSGNKAPTTAP